MGRILRTGTDTVINYSFLETSAYDEDNPAATTSPWDDSDAMDQLFDQANPDAVIDAQGALVTFERFPYAFYGAMVKVAANYDTSAGENPALELWVHDSVEDTWTKLRRILFANIFTGSPDGERKVFDLTFFFLLLNIDKVWITMDPGSTGSPTMDWYSIQLFGQCETGLQNPTGGSYDPCADPTDPFYPGDDVCSGNPWTSGPKPCAAPDYCNETSVQDYRECLRATVPAFLPIFDAWLDVNRTTIELFCSGNAPFPPNEPLPPPPNSPPLPPLDLCDQDSIDAFRAALAGDAEHVAQFDAYIDSLEENGFFALVCPEPDPDEIPIDPETLEPSPDPENVPSPFGSGPGGVPQIPRPPVPTQQAMPGPITTEYTHIFAKPHGTDTDDYVYCLTDLGGCSFDDLCGTDAVWRQDVRDRFINGALGDFGTDFVDEVVPGATITAFDLIQSTTMTMRFSGFLAGATVTIEAGVIVQGNNVDPGFVTIGNQLIETPDYTGVTPSFNVNLFKATFEDITTGFDYVMNFGAGLDVPTVCGNTFFIQAVVFRVRITQEDAVSNLRIELA